MYKNHGILEEITMNKPKIALTIAGTDPSGGAGVMADLKSFHACGVYGMAAITSIVAQNTKGVQHIHNLDPQWLAEQLDSVYDDELPHALKTGMIASKEMMELIQSYIAQHPEIPYVIDPVMLAKSGDSLMDDEGKNNLKSILLPLATVATPNIPEAEEITGLTIKNEADIYKAGQIFINEIGSKGVVIKGGHANDDTQNSTDYLFIKDEVYKFTEARYDTPHTHGTGCTFSAVITAELAKGKSIYEAVQKAKKFIALAIQYTPEIGQGRGPVNHFAYMKKEGLDDE
jgi:hydroxymethylpyrimidine/phosphomethylpyrimidine kinase